jgi:hypothetical protein
MSVSSASSLSSLSSAISLSSFSPLTRSMRSCSGSLSEFCEEDNENEVVFITKLLVSEAKIKIGSALFDCSIESLSFQERHQEAFKAEFGKLLLVQTIQYCKRYLQGIYRTFLGQNFFEAESFDLDDLIEFVLNRNVFKSKKNFTEGLQSLIDCFLDRKLSLELIDLSLNRLVNKTISKVATEYINDFISQIALPTTSIPFRTIDELNLLVKRKVCLIDADNKKLCELFRGIFRKKMPQVHEFFVGDLDLFTITKENFKKNPFFNAVELAEKLGVLWTVYNQKKEISTFKFVEAISNFLRVTNLNSKVCLRPYEFLAINLFGIVKDAVWKDVLSRSEFFIRSVEIEVFIDRIHILFFLRTLEVRKFFDSQNPLYDFIKRYNRFFSYPYPRIMESVSPLSDAFFSLIQESEHLKAFTEEEIAHHIKTGFEELDKKSLEYKFLHFEHKTVYEDNMGQTEEFILEETFKNYARLFEVAPKLKMLGTDHKKIVHALVLYLSEVFTSQEPIVVFAIAAGHCQFLDHRKALNFEEVKTFAFRAYEEFDREKVRDLALVWYRNKECIYAWYKMFPAGAKEMIEAFKKARQENPLLDHQLVINSASEDFGHDLETVESFYKCWWFQGNKALKSHEFGLRIAGCSVTDLALDYAFISQYSKEGPYGKEKELDKENLIIKTQKEFEELYPDLIFDKVKCRLKILQIPK